MFAQGNMGQLLAQLRDYADMKARAAIARLVHFTYYSGNSATGTQDNVECDHSDPNAGSYLVRRMQHFGFRSRPPSGVAAIRLGNYEAAGNSVVVAEDSERYGPGDLADGEMALYNKQSGTEIRLKADGSITINAGSGSDVVVNGGTAKVSRVGDATDMGTWVHVPASGAGVTPCSLTYQAPGAGSPTPITTGSALSGKISGGADHFKG